MKSYFLMILLKYSFSDDQLIDPRVFAQSVQ